MPYKKDLTPVTKGGKVDTHKGKGSKQALLPDRRAQPRPPANNMNNFAKSTPTLTQAAASPGILDG